MKQKKSASILKKFLIINLTVFSVLGLFTIIYLEAIQPTLVNERSKNHKVVINNTKDNLERLNIEYTKEGIRNFLLSTRFLFQSLDRVQFYDLSGNLLGDTNILDLDQNVFTRSDRIIEETIDGQIKDKIDSKKLIKKQNKNLIDICSSQAEDALSRNNNFSWVKNCLESLANFLQIEVINKIEGFVIKCPTFLINNKLLPCNLRPFPSLEIKLLSGLSFLSNFFPFFSNCTFRSPLIRPSQFL